jgi:predicted ATPase/DNA-binding XRE family transcriptional regulator
MTLDDLPLGLILRRHRASAGLTQEALAELAGISTRTVSDVERGLRHAVYRDTAERLAEALRLEGEERVRFEAIASGRRRAASTQPFAAETPTVGIPLQLTTLIGRERELDLVLAAIGADEHRLLTITGPGGIGKTRLAVEAATKVSVGREGSTFFIPLAANRDPELVAAAVAHAVGVRHTNEPPAEALRDYLLHRRTLLVLDTFEHVLDAAPLVGDLLASCPGLTILVTSRAALRLRGEHEIALAPLDLPPEFRAPHVGDLSRYSAVTLFMDRARAATPDIKLDDETGPIVAEICRRVDGLPLAIELAAARVKHLSLAALRDQLEHRLRVLVGGPRDLPPRHQAMDAAISWSYDLLEPHEQQLFRQLSIFAGGWTLEAAQSVCARGDRPEDALDGTSTLVDKSLVFLTESADGNFRYTMLDVIHEYASERRGGSEQADELGLRHADYFLRLAEDAEPALGGMEQDAWFHRLDAENENLRAALRHSVDRGDAERALRLSGALWQFWRRRGDIAEGRSWLEAALAMPGAADPRSRGKALWGAAWLAYHQSDFGRSESLGQQLNSSAREAGDRLGVRNALTILGKVATARSRFSQAIEPFREALAICRELGSGWLLATSVFNLGTATLLAGDLGGAEVLLDEAITLYRDVGDAHFAARVLGSLAYPALLRGDIDRAASLTATSLRLSMELGDSWGIAEALERISAVRAARGEYREHPGPGRRHARGESRVRRAARGPPGAARGPRCPGRP